MRLSTPGISLMTAAALALVVFAASAQDPEPLVSEGQIAPRLQNLGDYSHPVTTSVARAQLFFDQGFRLTYGFNHKEAGRSFREAARLDPNCAMCYWGQALVLGPNINAPMSAEAVQPAWEAIQKAIELKSQASEPERGFIDALATRYSEDPDADRSALDLAYAEAMGMLVARYPDDLDAATLYAEALMDLSPWNYWKGDGSPYPRTLQVVSLLESVIERNPDHPGAHHFYIHAVEASESPERGEQSADLLWKLAPGSGHLVHMPSHIYLRVGRYDDAAEANRQAVAADEDYIMQCRAQGLYPMAYYPHNIHFLWAATTREGRSQEAIDNAMKVAADAAKAKDENPFYQYFAVVPYYAWVRFGKWDEILAAPMPEDRFAFLQGIAHYARGMAFTGKGQLDEADAELESLKIVAAIPELKEAMLQANPITSVLQIAAHVLSAEIAAERKDYFTAVAHLDNAVRLEDGMTYTEPTDWYFPVRQALGAVLLEAGRAPEAETVYWEDLRRHPDNGWSLFGLWKSLEAQDKTEGAAEAKSKFDEAWSGADIELQASRVM